MHRLSKFLHLVGEVEESLDRDHQLSYVGSRRGEPMIV